MERRRLNRQIADALVLVRATPQQRKLLLAGWRNDNFYRRRTLRVQTWNYTNLPRMAGVLAQLGAHSAHATTAVHITLPWGDLVRLDHTLTQKLLQLAEQVLDDVDRTLPAQMSTPGTRPRSWTSTAPQISPYPVRTPAEPASGDRNALDLADGPARRVLHGLARYSGSGVLWFWR